MSAVLDLHSSPESLRRAIERLSAPGAGVPEHNAGACAGCGGGLGRGACGPNGCVKGPGGLGMSPGAASMARTLLNMFGGAGMLARLKAAGQIGGNLDLRAIAAALDIESDCTPYEDAVRDCLMMDTLVSAEVAVTVAGSVTISVSAAQGWFFAYYFDINVKRPGTPPAVTCIDPCQYNMTQPTVQGCPPPPCQPGGNIARSANFYVKRETASGCGRPFQAVIPSTSQGAPIDVVVSGTAIAVGDLVQVQYRGFCFDTRICC